MFSLFIAYAAGGSRERFNPMTGFRYKDGMDHDTLDQNALLNEFSGNKVPFRKTNTYDGNPNSKPRTRRGKGAQQPYPKKKLFKSNSGGDKPAIDKPPVASTSKAQGTK